MTLTFAVGLLALAPVVSRALPAQTVVTPPAGKSMGVRVTPFLIMRLMILVIVVLAVAPFQPGAAPSAQTMKTVTAVSDTTRRPLTVASVVGCYDLSRTAWYNLPRVRIGEVAWPDSLLAPGRSDLQFGYQHEPPRQVRMLLDADGREGGAQWHPLEPKGPDTLGVHRWGERGWRIRGNSVVAYWSNGFVGVRLNMLATDFGLEGTAVATSDVVGPFPVPAARVTLLRTRCRD